MIKQTILQTYEFLTSFISDFELLLGVEEKGTKLKEDGLSEGKVGGSDLDKELDDHRWSTCPALARNGPGVSELSVNNGDELIIDLIAWFIAGFIAGFIAWFIAGFGVG